ncbi:MAG: hypothetical protein ACI4ED_05985 [Suilimivivens sp.]
MTYSIYELAWFFFIYSFIGWCGEVCLAAVQKRKFVNRGFVNSPFCPVYGIGAVSFAIFLPELSGNLFFLFLGGVILASFIEFMTGALLERIFHKKWWDYSAIRFNFEGYICLRYSLLWGVFAVLLILFVNPLLKIVICLLPELLGTILLWVLSVLLVIDVLGTSLTILGMQKKMAQVSEWSEGIGQISKVLENAITEKIRRRMEKAFPALEEREASAKEKAKEKTVFAKGCCFYKLICLFFLGAFLGDITETIFCLVTTGVLMSRSSVVYGPFSIVWGLGCALLTAVLYRIKDKSDSYIFVAGTLLGGAYEYICSVFTELVFGTVFWDYSGFRFNLGGRINLLYCFFWGIAAVVWMKLLYPGFSMWIEKLPVKAGTILCNAAIVFMVFNCIISSLALSRYTERNTVSEEGQNRNVESGFDTFLDEHFPDERMERIYPNAKIVE